MSFLIPVHTSCLAGFEITLNKDLKERKEEGGWLVERGCGGWRVGGLKESHGWMQIVGSVPEGVHCGQPPAHSSLVFV